MLSSTTLLSTASNSSVVAVDRGERVDVTVEDVVVDDHRIGGVGGRGGVVGDDGGDRFAHEANAVGGEQRAGDGSG